MRKKKLEATKMEFNRIVLRVLGTEHWSNDNVLKTMEIKKGILYLTSGRLS